MSRYKDIVKESSKKANRLFLLIGGILLLVGVACTIWGIMIFVKAAGAKENVCVQNPSDLKEGQWYTIETNTIIAGYAHNDDGVDYITWVGENYEDAAFISLFVPEKKTDKAGLIVKDTQAYLKGETSSLSNQWLTGKGYIRKMEGTEKQYYEKWLSEQGLSSENRVMYTFSMVSPWTAMGEQNVRKVFIYGCIFALIGIGMILARVFGANWSGIKKTKAKYGVNDEDLEADMESALVAANVNVGSKYTIVSQAGPLLFVNKHLIWVYPTKTITQHKTYGINTGKTTTYAVAFCDRDGATKTCPTKSEEVSKEIVEAVHVRAPYIICGYNPNVDNTIKAGQIRQVVAYVDQQRKEMEGSAPMSGAEYLDTNYGTRQAQQGQSPYAPKPEQGQQQNAYVSQESVAGESPYAPKPEQGQQQNAYVSKESVAGGSPYAPKPERDQQQNAYVSKESVAGGNSAFTPLGEEGTTVLTAESPLAGDAQFAFEQSPDDEPTSVIENPFEK